MALSTTIELCDAGLDEVRRELLPGRARLGERQRVLHFAARSRILTSASSNCSSTYIPSGLPSSLSSSLNPDASRRRPPPASPARARGSGRKNGRPRRSASSVHAVDEFRDAFRRGGGAVDAACLRAWGIDAGVPEIGRRPTDLTFTLRTSSATVTSLFHRTSFVTRRRDSRVSSVSAMSRPPAWHVEPPSIPLPADRERGVDVPAATRALLSRRLRSRNVQNSSRADEPARRRRGRRVRRLHVRRRAARRDRREHRRDRAPQGDPRRSCSSCSPSDASFVLEAKKAAAPSCRAQLETTDQPPRRGKSAGPRWWRTPRCASTR